MPNPQQGSPSSETSLEQPSKAFRQEIGLFDATMLVMGVMIGSGIFVVSSSTAKDLGSPGWFLMAWVVAGIMTLLGALCYAELAGMIPHAGGQYLYLREAFGPLSAFLYGWTLFAVIQTGSIAAVGVAFSKYLGVFVPSLGIGEESLIFESGSFKVYTGQFVALALIWVITLLNCVGVKEGKLFQNAFTVAKIGGMVMVIAVVLGWGINQGAVNANFSNIWSGATETESFQTLQAQFSALPSTMVIWMILGGALVGPLFSSDAWNNVTYAGSEVKNPRRTLPLSLALGTIGTTILYLIMNLTYMVALPVNGVESPEASTFERGISHALDERPAAAAMETVLPNRGAWLVAAAVMISTAGCINGLILMGARLYFAMSKDGLFFSQAGVLNDRGVPVIGLMLQSAWTSVLLFSGKYNDLLDYVMFAAILFYALTVIGLIRLRKSHSQAERPYRVWPYPLIPIVYIALCCIVGINLLIVKPMYTWPGVIIVLLGIPLYTMISRRQPK